MKTFEIISREDNMMGNIRELIPQIVGIRLEAQKAALWLNEQGAELATVAEEMEDAIDALYQAESAMGNAHQYLLVSQSTIKHGLKEEKPE